MRVHRPHRDRIRTVGRRRDAAIHNLPVLGLAEIPGRRHDDNADPDRALDGLAQRIVAERLQHGPPERQVDDADVELPPVRDRPVDCLDHIARIPRPIVVKRAQVDEVRPRRDALVLARVERASDLAGDDRRHVRAVPVEVSTAASREVHRRDHPIPQRAVPRVDARVDDGDANPRARERRQVAHAGPHLIGANTLGRHVGCRSQANVAGQMIDRVVRLQRGQLAGRHAQNAAAPQVAPDRQVVPGGERVNRRFVAVDDDVDGLRAGGEMVREVGAQTRAMRAGLRVGRRRGRGAPEHQGEGPDDRTAFVGPWRRKRGTHLRLQLFHRIEQDALAAANRPDCPEPAFPDAVIYGSARDAQELSGMV